MSLRHGAAVLLASSMVMQQAPQAADIQDADGVAQQLEYLRNRPSLYDFGLPSGYYDRKKQLREERGFSIGLSSFVLGQTSSATSSAGDDTALGGIYRLQGSWEAFGRGSSHPGELSFRLEYRTSHLGAPAPASLSSNSGIRALNTGVLYVENFDLDLSVLNWTQYFFDKHTAIAVGRLAFINYQDSFAFQTVNRTFINQAFVRNPTTPATGIGALGMVARSRVGNHLWVGAQIYDANAVNGEFELDTIQENEWQKALEIGWTPDFSKRGTDLIQLTYWRKDRREDFNISPGSGWALTASNQFNDQWIGFVRYGNSDGGGGVSAREAASAGVEYSPRQAIDWSIGLGYAEPANRELDNEYVFESAIKLQLTPEFSLMPDLQVLLNPADNPDESSIVVVSLRAILAL